jgi:hypothetical protein
VQFYVADVMSVFHGDDELTQRGRGISAIMSLPARLRIAGRLRWSGWRGLSEQAGQVGDRVDDLVGDPGRAVVRGVGLRGATGVGEIGYHEFRHAALRTHP